MTERKPPGVSFESWVEKQIREAAERGAFDNLAGAGKPLPGLHQPYDENWWVKDKLRRENVSYTPPTLALRRDAEDAVEAALNAQSESEVREIIGKINERISAAIRRPMTGPPLNLVPYDVERIVEQWRQQGG